VPAETETLTIVGQRYVAPDDRRESGFTIELQGINIGAGIAPIVAASSRERVSALPRRPRFRRVPVLGSSRSPRGDR